MKTMPDGEGLEASPAQLGSSRTDTADPCPPYPRAACRPRRIQVLLRICLCCCAVTSSLLLSSLQSSTRREWNPALLRIDTMHFFFEASCAWVFVLLVAYQPRSVCWTAGRCWPSTTGYKRVWTPPDVLLQDGLRFVLAAAALLTPHAAGQAPQLTAKQLQKLGKLYGTRLFAPGLDARGLRLFEHVTQHPAVCEGNEKACFNSSERPRRSLASHASHGTAARGGRRQRLSEVRRSRSKMVSGYLRLKTASSLPASSAPPAETGKPNKPRSGAERSPKRTAAATGAADRVLAAVVPPAQNQKRMRVLSSSRVTQSIEDQRAKPTIEQRGTGAAAGPAQVDTPEAVDARVAPAVGDQLEREGVQQSFSKVKARDDGRVRTLGVLENNAFPAWQQSTRFSHGAPTVSMSFSQPPSTGPENLTDYLLYADIPGDQAHNAKPNASHQRDPRRAGSLGSFASSVSRPSGGGKEKPAGITEPQLTVAVAKKERRTHPRGDSERGEQTDDADDSTSYHAAAEAPQKNAGPAEIKPDTISGLSQPNKHEQLVMPWRSPGNVDDYYRVEDTPKIYGDSGHTVGGPVVWEKPAVSSVGRGRPRKERWVPEDVQSKGVDAQDTQGRRESLAKNDLIDEVDWADPESLSRAESFLRHQMRGLERQVSVLEDQLKGIEADMEVYRAGIEGVNPDRNADTFEKLVYGGQSLSHQVLLEKLQTASGSLDSRVKMYVRTNTTFYANQLNDIVQVRLAPLRQGVLDLSLSLMDAATSTIDITRQLHEAAGHVNATTAREAAQMEALRARREAAFTEALEEEEIAMQAQLVASKHREQSRVNKSSVEEQILLSAIEGAVDDMDKRGFAVLDFSAVYPESEARKVLDLTLYFAHLQTRAHRWEVLPIVVVPSSGFLGHIEMPQTASEWLTSVLASADGAFSSSTSNQAASIVSHGGALSAARTAGRKKRKGGNPTLPSLSIPRRTSNRIIEYDTTTTDESGGSPAFGTAFAGEEATKGSSTQNHYRDFRISRKRSFYKWDARPSWTLAAGLNEHHEDRNKFRSHAQSVMSDTGQVDTNNSAAGIAGQDDTAEGQPGQLSQSDFLPTHAEGSSAGARAATAAEQPKTAHEGNDAERVRQADTSGTVRRLVGLGVDSSVDLAGVRLSRAAASSPERAFSGGVKYGEQCDIQQCSRDLQRMGPRRLSVLNRVWSGRFNRAVGLGRIRREVRNKTVGFGSKERTAQAGPAQLFYAPQFILGESHSGVDQVETGRKWQASVLRKTQAVVASWWGEPGYMGADSSESREIRSILPPTFTLQHLVREHFEQSHAKEERNGFSSREQRLRFTAGDAAHHQEANLAGSGAAGAPPSPASAGTSGLTAQPTAPQSHRKNGLEQLESRLGYYVLRAEQILLEGFYVAPGGEVSSVLLRYPHLRDLGSLVPAGQYGVQLLRQLVTSLHANAEMRKSCPHKTAAAASAAPSQLPADKHVPTDGRAVNRGDSAGQARASPSRAKAASGAQPARGARRKTDKAPENGPACTPASYNPFLLCLASPRLSTSAHGGPSSVTGAAGTGYGADDGRDLSAPRTGEQDRSHRSVSREPGLGWSEARHPHEQTVMHKTAAERAAGCNANESVDAPVAPAQCASQLSREKTALNHGGEVEEELLLHRKVLIIHLGPRSDGLPLAYPDGAGGKELHRQRLVRHSLTELLVSSERTDSCVDDCGGCLAEAGGMQTPPSQGQKPAERKDAASSGDTGTGDGSERAPETPLRRSGVWGTGVEAGVLKPREATQWPARFGLLRAGGAVDPDTVTLTKALKDLKLESAVRKQLLALEQELRLASPTRWAVEGAVVEKHLENYQVEILVAWGRPPPALQLPLTPFFTHNVLLIRVEVEKCPRKYGDNSYSVPPNSVLEHALYLLAHPVAGLAALAAFHYGKNSGKPFLERLRKGHEHWDVTPSGLAMHAANFWGRATGASMHTFWIAQVRIKAPGHPGGSSIELLDGRLHGEGGSFVPLSDSQKSDRRILFPGEAEAWGWRYADPLTPDEGPFLQGRLAGYGDAATTCKAVDALVQSTAANLQTRVVPQKFVSGLRGRSLILAFSSTEVPFKGEQLVSLADRETEGSAETSPKKTALP